MGAILVVAGPAGLAAAVRVLLGHAGLVLIGMALAALLYNLAPQGTLAGPVVLAAVGGAVLAWQRGWWSARSIWALVGLALALTGGALVIRKDPGVVTTEPVRRIVAPAVRRRLAFRSEEGAPERLRLVAVAARIDVDLRQAQPPAYGPMEVFVSCWGGTICFDIPDSWAVVAGRLTAARSIRFEGILDSADTFPDPDDPEMAERLAQIASSRKDSTGATDVGAAIVVHVLGIGGSVTVDRR